MWGYYISLVLLLGCNNVTDSDHADLFLFIALLPRLHTSVVCVHTCVHAGLCWSMFVPYAALNCLACYSAPAIANLHIAVLCVRIFMMMDSITLCTGVRAP